VGSIPRRIHHFIAMNKFIPRGYISIRKALNRVGRELFGSDWTGAEHRARRGLLSEEAWLQIKDVPPARGSGATGASSPVPTRSQSTDDPCSPSYQEEFRAGNRYAQTCHKLREMLEAGDLEAAILDPWSGTLHRASLALWRRSDADRMIKEGRAPIPSSRNTGTLLVKDLGESDRRATPISRADMGNVIKALQEKTRGETLTRPQQKDFVRKNFPNSDITERQFNEIFRSVPVDPGRPKKSDKKL